MCVCAQGGGAAASSVPVVSRELLGREALGERVHIVYALSKDWALSVTRESRFPFIPLQHWLFTPELQWQSRGKMAYLTGVSVNGKRPVQGLRVGAVYTESTLALPPLQVGVRSISASSAVYMVSPSSVPGCKHALP
jgi:hypothetical protein